MKPVLDGLKLLAILAVVLLAGCFEDIEQGDEKTPDAPTGIAGVGGDQQVNVSWNGVSGATSYNIYWATTTGVTTASNKITGVVSPYTHSGRTNGQQYCYRVTAENASGEGPLSTEDCAIPIALTPVAPTSHAPSRGHGPV